MIFPERFARKTLLITGAAQGIGLAVARRAANEGAFLVLVDRVNFLKYVAEELSQVTKIHYVVADLETSAGAEDAIAQTLERFGCLDVLINVVGGTIWMKPLHEYKPSEIEAEIKRSLFPTLWCCRAALPQMIRQQGGVIVNVSSVATRGIHRVPYSAAKGGINAITASLAMEYAEYGIRVVATAPGGTAAPQRTVPRNAHEKSEQEKIWGEEVVNQTVQSSLMKRYGSLEEQAAGILFLASAEASYITGTTLPIAGGDLG